MVKVCRNPAELFRKTKETLFAGSGSVCNFQERQNLFGTQELRKIYFSIPEFLSSKFKMTHYLFAA